jgi:hypothetical protein
LAHQLELLCLHLLPLLDLWHHHPLFHVLFLLMVLY